MKLPKFRARWPITVVGFCFLLVACETLSDFFAEPGSTGNIPFKPSRALTGSQFINLTKNMTALQREQAIYQQLRMGNIPNFLKNLKAVRLSARGSDGKMHSGMVWVMPDYLSIGSDNDFVRIPMTPMTAQKIADQFGYTLPTRKLVNAIYAQATLKLPPQPMPPGASMTSNDYYRRHNQTIERQLGKKSRTLLIAGHKKDIVITNQLNQLPDRVAIYGWHRLNGEAIQPLSLVHGKNYADYSHGVRLVRRVMLVDGSSKSIGDVLRNPKYAPLLSDEGPISNSKLSVAYEGNQNPIPLHRFTGTDNRNGNWNR